MARTAAGFLAAFAALLALPLQAQAQTTLVSNLGQTHVATAGYSVGVIGASKFSQAQQFTTGDNAAGYALSSIQVYIRSFDSTDSARVSIYEADASGNPDSSRYTL